MTICPNKDLDSTLPFLRSAQGLTMSMRVKAIIISTIWAKLGYWKRQFQLS